MAISSREFPRADEHRRERRRCLLPAALVAGLGWVVGAIAAPATCADMQVRLEKQLAAKGAAHPPLQIVPKGLAAGTTVLGSCENGTQRIVYKRVPATAAEAASTAASTPPKKPAR